MGREPAGRGPTALRVRVSQLRKALKRAGDDVLVTRPPGYALLVPRDGLDLWRFERALDEGERALRADPQRALDALTQALAEWRGAPLVDVAHAPFAQAATVRLEELRASALELRIEAELALGRHATPDRRAVRPHQRAPAARTTVGSADDGALPRRPPGRRAGGLPDRPRAARRGDRHRARAGAQGPRGADPRAGPRPRSRSVRRRRARRAPCSRSARTAAPPPPWPSGSRRPRTGRPWRSASCARAVTSPARRRSSVQRRPAPASPRSRPTIPPATPSAWPPSRTPRSCCSPLAATPEIDEQTATVLRAAACDVAMLAGDHASRRRPGARALLRPQPRLGGGRARRLARRRRRDAARRPQPGRRPPRRQPPARQRVARAAARRRRPRGDAADRRGRRTACSRRPREPRRWSSDSRIAGRARVSARPGPSSSARHRAPCCSCGAASARAAWRRRGR